ncbi:histidine kinase [Paenibacillus sp. J5C_2022]|uniref:sensor histidine kinase n=1 Tax=Paenibacillus sp. J5C2022 TaxID=2977129 RepID=UPI0021D39BD6|nr:sensor histidine kinase [Paenibacillus sp. J5C2022]MCU6707789.1 histidine kinase [Paenibacillus sp. J5C2022]
MRKRLRKGEWRLYPLLFGIFILFTSTFMVTITTIIYYRVSAILTEQTSETRLQLIAETEKQFTSRIREIEETSLMISTNPKLLEALSGSKSDLLNEARTREEIRQIVDRVTYTKPSISGIQLYSDRFDNSSKIASERVMPLADMNWPNDMERLEYSDSLWIGSHMESGLPGHSAPVVTFIRKIYMYNGKVGGYLVIHVAESLLSALFDASERRSPGSLVVFDGGSRIMLARNDTVAGQAPPLEDIAEWNRAIPGQREGYFRKSFDGRPYLVIHSSANQAQWRVIEIIPSDLLFKDIGTIRSWAIVIGLLGILFSLPAAFYVSRKITKPLPEILAGFKKIPSGNFEVRLGERNRITEFRLLTEGFNRMSQELKQLLIRLDEENKAKQRAELAALQSQINPHFLYNALDLINWTAAMKGVPEVSVMATKLAKLFRISLSRGNGMIRLREELEHCALYAQIQQARYPELFLLTIQENAKTDNLFVPKLILQPFVENAIIHGFVEPSSSHYEIEIRAEQLDESTLSLVIEDNGAGLKAHSGERAEEEPIMSTSSASGSSGYGTYNVRQRIRLYFGERYDVRLERRESGGTRVTLTLPVLKTEEELAIYQR